jgi:hypothetical protein
VNQGRSAGLFNHVNNIFDFHVQSLDPTSKLDAAYFNSSHTWKAGRVSLWGTSPGAVLIGDDFVEPVNDLGEFLRGQAGDSLADSFSGQGPNLAHFDPRAFGKTL